MLMSDSPICLWPQCNELFMCVEDLIQHVEEEHVMSDTNSLSFDDTVFDIHRKDSGLDSVSSLSGSYTSAHTSNNSLQQADAKASASSTTFAHTASLPTCFTQSMELCGPSSYTGSNISDIGNATQSNTTVYTTAKSVGMDSPVSRFIHMSHVSPYFTDEERAVRRKQQELCRRRPIVHNTLLLDNDFADMDLDLPLRKRRKSSGVDSAYGFDLSDTQIGSRSYSPADSAIGSPIYEVPVKTSQFADGVSSATVSTAAVTTCNCTPSATVSSSATAASTNTSVCDCESTLPSTCSSTCLSRASSTSDAEKSAQPVVKKLDTFSREIIAASSAQIDPSEKRPYRCPVPSCDKQYKNLNGIKYHSQHGHTNLALEQQVYQCHLQTENGSTETTCNQILRSSACMKEHVKQAHPAFVERVGRERNPRPSISKASTQTPKATATQAPKPAITPTPTPTQFQPHPQSQTTTQAPVAPVHAQAHIATQVQVQV